MDEALKKSTYGLVQLSDFRVRFCRFARARGWATLEVGLKADSIHTHRKRGRSWRNKLDERQPVRAKSSAFGPAFAIPDR